MPLPSHALRSFSTGSAWKHRRRRRLVAILGTGVVASVGLFLRASPVERRNAAILAHEEQGAISDPAMLLGTSQIKQHHSAADGLRLPDRRPAEQIQPRSCTVMRKLDPRAIRPGSYRLFSRKRQ